MTRSIFARLGVALTLAAASIAAAAHAIDTALVRVGLFVVAMLAPNARVPRDTFASRRETWGGTRMQGGFFAAMRHEARSRSRLGAPRHI